MRPRRTAALVAAAGSLLLGPAPAAQADVERGLRDVPYTCVSSDLPGDRTVTVSMALNTPDAAIPGQELTLSGRLLIAFSQREQPVTSAIETETHTEDFSIPTTIGGATTPLIPELVRPEATSDGETYRFGGEVTFPPLNVPATATGHVELALPVAEVPNTVSDEPTKVAFTVHVRSTGPVPYAYALACRPADPDADLVLARIPLRHAAPAPATHSIPPDTHERSGTEPLPNAPGIPPAGAGRTEARPPDAAAPAPAELAPEVPDLIPTEAVTIPAEDDGWTISFWTVILLGVAVSVLAICYSGWTGYRIRLVRAELDNTVGVAVFGGSTAFPATLTAAQRATA